MNQKEAYEQGKANGYQAATFAVDSVEDSADELFGLPYEALEQEDYEEALYHAAYGNEQHARQYSGFAGFAAEINNGPESRFEGLWEKYDEGVTVGINKGVKEWLKGQRQNPADLPSRAADLAEAWKHSHAELLKGRIGSLEAGKERRYILRMAEDEGVLDEVMDLIGKRKNPRKLRKRIPKKIEIWGKRWFQRSYGNTYHSVRIYLNDKLAYESPITYGYGDHYYNTTAKEWLVENGYLPPGEPVWYLRDHNGVDLIYHATDVKRERDL